MATKYKYTISIVFVHPNSNLAALSPMEIEYYPALTDTFKFYKKSIKIIAKRWKRINDSVQDLYETENAINLQIQKAVEFYYITSPRLTKISRISIKVESNKTQYTYSNANNYKQPLPYHRNISNKWCLPVVSVLDMMQLNGNGPAYRIALSYCLRTIVRSNDFSEFSLLWRAFNALYRRASKSPIDAHGLGHIKRLISANYANFTQSQSQLPNYIRQYSSLRWKTFLSTKLGLDMARVNPTTNLQGTSTRNFLLQYKDCRINQLFFDILQENRHIRDKIWNLRGTSLRTINTHINQRITANQQYDAEILILLVNNYTYFLRNTLFHGAVDDPYFAIGHTKEQEELGMAKIWLENLIKDLLNNHLI